MTIVSYDNLRTRALQVMNEVAGFANSETRVGSLFRDIVDSLSGMLGSMSIQGFGALTTNTGAQNDTAISAAVTAALAANASLYWQPGTYVSAASIPNFHSVRHWGPGAIQRGSDVFYVDPRSAQTNRLYLASTGSSANDGLSASQPMATPQNAFDALKNYGPELDGTWRIVCAAGTWNGTVHRNQHTTPSKNPVIVEGPSVGGHPNVPTAIFDGAIGAVSDDWAIRAVGYGVQIDLHDVKGRNYSGGGGSPAAFFGDYGASFYFTNLHGSGNGYSDIYLQGCVTVRGGGGIMASPRGAYVNACGDTTLGYGTAIRFSGCTNTGVEFARGSEGHIDNCEFLDCGVGVDIFHNARAHLMTNNFKRSTVAAIRARTGGYYYENGNTFNDGGADANAVRFLNYAYSGESDADLWDSVSARRNFISTTSPSHTGTTTKQTLLTCNTIDANWFSDTTKRIEVHIFGDLGTSATSQVGVDLWDGTTATEVDLIQVPGAPAGATTPFEYVCKIFPNNPATLTALRRYASLEVSGLVPVKQRGGVTVSLSVNQAIRVTAKLGNAGDSVVIGRVEVWLIG